MDISTVINTYMAEHDISLREFSRRSGLSPAQVSFLINGRNGKPVKPTIETYEKISKVTDISVSSLIAVNDDEDNAKLYANEHETELLDIYRSLPFNYQTMLLLTARSMKETSEREVLL